MLVRVRLFINYVKRLYQGLEQRVQEVWRGRGVEARRLSSSPQVVKSVRRRRVKWVQRRG